MKQDATPDITPEGRRAAEKVRTIFFLIAAANIVLVAIVLWSRHTPGDPPRPEEMAQVVERAIAAYNAKDRTAFLASFSAAAEPRADAAFFDSVILGEYHRDFGAIIASTLNPARTSGATRGYDVACEKHPHERLTVEFIRENNTAKVLRWRMER